MPSCSVHLRSDSKRHRLLRQLHDMIHHPLLTICTVHSCDSHGGISADVHHLIPPCGVSFS